MREHPEFRRRHALGTLGLLGLLLLPGAARAAFSTTDVQLRQGWGFDDGRLFQLDGGRLTTLSFHSFSTWEHGDSFFSADLTRGRQGGRDTTGLYAEWHPRLLLGALLGQREPILGVIRNWGLAAEVNQAGGFHAYLVGLGVDFAVPAGWVIGLNAYYRQDQYAGDQWQVSPFWIIPFPAGPVPMRLAGYLDVSGTSRAGRRGWELRAQPQLLADLLAPFGGRAGRLLAGAEWYVDRVAVPGQRAVSSVPQVVLQWTVH